MKKQDINNMDEVFAAEFDDNFGKNRNRRSNTIKEVPKFGLRDTYAKKLAQARVRPVRVLIEMTNLSIEPAQKS